MWASAKQARPADGDVRPLAVGWTARPAHEIAAASAIAVVEARAGLARARRARRLTARKEREAWTRFDRIWSTSAILEVDRTLLAITTELAGRHGLRGYDAVQLASGRAPLT